MELIMPDQDLVIYNTTRWQECITRHVVKARQWDGVQTSMGELGKRRLEFYLPNPDYPGTYDWQPVSEEFGQFYHQNYTEAVAWVEKCRAVQIQNAERNIRDLTALVERLRGSRYPSEPPAAEDENGVITLLPSSTKPVEEEKSILEWREMGKMSRGMLICPACPARGNGKLLTRTTLLQGQSTYKCCECGHEWGE